MSATPLFVAAAGGMFAGILAGRAAGRLWLATTLLGLIAAFTGAVTVLAGGVLAVTVGVGLIAPATMVGKGIVIPGLLRRTNGNAPAVGDFFRVDGPGIHEVAVVPVDLYIPGCPPHPLTILDGLLRLLDRLEGN